MTSSLKCTLLLVILTFMCILVESNDREDIRKRNVFRRFRQRPRQMRNQFEALRRHHLTEMGTLDNSSEWVQSFIPDMPNAADVDCNIEVEVIERIGGRCVRLGGSRRIAVCQSGMYLDVQSEECQYILAARELNELRQQLEQSHAAQASQGTSTGNGVTEHVNTAQQADDSD